MIKIWGTSGCCVLLYIFLGLDLMVVSVLFVFKFDFKTRSGSCDVSLVFSLHVGI
jgi:hypothetical protein